MHSTGSAPDPGARPLAPGWARRFVLLMTLVTAGCGGDARPPDAPAGATVITVWYHAGRQAEREIVQERIRRFHAEQSAVYVRGNVIPEDTYNGQVQAAALAGDLPDLLELDGPFLANYVWQGHLQPLDDHLDADLREDLLPSILAQGRMRGVLYAVGAYDSGLGLFGRRSALAAAGIRVPAAPAEAWSAGEFDALLDALAERDPDGAVLDLKLNVRGEWLTYAFAPALSSAGGGLIASGAIPVAAGTLDNAGSVAALRRIQSWIRRGRVDENVDDAAFTAGRVPLSWSGHWDYPRYAAAAGDDLVVLPLPDFGRGTRTGQGSWCWGITSASRHPEAAARFLRFLLRPEAVLAMAGAAGAPPSRRSAIARSPIYRAGGPLRLFALQLAEGLSVPRPRTPAYPVITDVFQRAFQDIRHGADVNAVLVRAAAAIDADIRANDGYRSQE